MTGPGAWLAAQKGLDPADFDRWTWVWGRYPSTPALVATLIALLLFLALSWRAARTLDRPWQRAVSLALRGAAAILIAILVFDPSAEFLKTRRREETFAVLIDRSRSMTLKTLSGAPRIDLVKKYFTDHAADFAALEKRYRVTYASFDAASNRMTGADVARLEADRGKTQIGESIDDLLRAGAAAPPAGILLFSDGADRGRLSVTAGLEGPLSPVPVHPVLLPAETPPDAAVLEVAADAYAFVRNGFDVRARLSLRGIKAATVSATLRIDGEVSGAQSVAVPAKGGEVEVKFRVTPQRVGRYVYTVEIPSFPGEAVTENNRRSAVIKVVRDRVRVLQVVGEPSWDERFLRRYLEKDPNVDLISFMILRTREDLDATPEGELSLIPFPTRELFTDELKTFDLVIFQNFDYRPYFELFPGQLLDNIRRFVENDGGGLLMIGGDKSFSQGGYAGSPLDPILPVELIPAAGVNTDPFQAVLTPDGVHHPITGLDLPPGETQAIWRGMPALQGVNVTGRTRPGATALLTHPRWKTGDGAPMPVLAVMEAGKGRTMSLAADASWMWNFAAAGAGGSAAPYQRFWNGAVRWLVHDPEFGRVRLETDREATDPGDPVKLRCTVLDENYRPAAKAEVTLTAKNRETRSEQSLTTGEAGPGIFSSEFAPATMGAWEIRCAAKLNSKPIGDDTALVVSDSLGEEMKDTAVHNELLTALARRSGGKVLDIRGGGMASALDFEKDPPFEVIARKVVPLWDNYLWLGVLAMLFSLDWLLRRRWGGL